MFAIIFSFVLLSSAFIFIITNKVEFHIFPQIKKLVILPEFHIKLIFLRNKSNIFKEKYGIIFL